MSPPSAGSKRETLPARVLHVIDQGVAARFGLMLSQTLPSLPTEALRIAQLTDDVRFIERFADTAVECHFHDALTGWRSWRLAHHLGRRFDPPPTLVHLWGTQSLTQVERWTQRVGTPVIIHLLSMHDADVIVRRGVRSYEQIVSVSSEFLTRIEQRFPMARGRFRHMSPAVALPIHPTQPPTEKEVLGVVAVTTIDDQADVNVLVDALAQLRPSGAELMVAIVGAGPAVDATWRHIRTRKVSSACWVIDEPGLWERALPDVDIVVVPGRERDLWLAPLFAMGLGKVVIAARGQPGEWFVDQETCWQFTPGSAVELAYLLARVREQPKHTRELCARAAEFVRSKHSVGQLIRQLHEFYGVRPEIDTAAASAPPTDKERDEHQG